MREIERVRDRERARLRERDREREREREGERGRERDFHATTYDLRTGLICLFKSPRHICSFTRQLPRYNHIKITPEQPHFSPHHLEGWVKMKSGASLNQFNLGKIVKS